MMWGGPGRRPLSMTVWIIIVNAAVFFGSALLGPRAVDLSREYGAFSTHTFLKLEVWRLLSFQFLHADITHILFNMFGLWIFGAMVEEYLGRKKYLAFYLVCGICGGLMFLLLNLGGVLFTKAGLHPLPGLLVYKLQSPLIGASAGVFGVIIGAAYIRPNEQMQLLFPPVTLPLKWLAYGYVAIAAINLLTGSANAGGEAAHLGGALAGFIFVRNNHLLRDFFDIMEDSRKAPDFRSTSSRDPSRKGGLASSLKKLVGAKEITQQEVDAILDKIKVHGMGSLSDAEKNKLRKFNEQGGIKNG